jgi:hypothetical protein
MPLPPKSDHRISLDAAARATARHRAAAGAGRGNAPPGRPAGPYGFHAEAFERILSQPGCVGIRAYPAAHEDGTPSLVLVGVDADGNDMTAGHLANDPWQCPPLCPPDESKLAGGA